MRLTAILALFSILHLHSQPTEYFTSTQFYNSPLHSAFFLNEQIGWIGSSVKIPSPTTTKIYKTIDGGITWDSVSIPLIRTFYSGSKVSPIFFWDQNDGILYDGHDLYRSNNGGDTWSHLAPGVGKVKFNNDEILISENYPLISLDRGQSWKSINITWPQSGWRDLIKKEQDLFTLDVELGAETFILNKWHLIDRDSLFDHDPALSDSLYIQAKRGYRMFLCLDKMIYIAADSLPGGSLANRKPQVIMVDNEDINSYKSFNSKKSIFSIASASESLAYAVGASGLIYRITNNGEMWTELPQISTSDFVDILFVNENIGWIVGAEGTLIQMEIEYGIPVELISFEVEKISNQVSLTWSTSTEANNAGFDIEKSFDGKNFNKITFINGAGTTTEPQFYSYTDNDISESSKLFYRLKQNDLDGSYEYSKTIEVDLIPQQFSLSQNYPNPFNPSTTIEYSLPSTGHVLLKVYDVLGNEIATLINEEKEGGFYTLNFDASKYASGVYAYSLFSNDQRITRKMLLQK